MATVVTLVTFITLVAFVGVTFVKGVSMRPLNDVHGMNVYRAGHVCPYDSTREPLDGFG
jgi:hypothetical protein